MSKSNILINQIIKMTKKNEVIYLTTDFRGFYNYGYFSNANYFFSDLFKEFKKKQITAVIPAYTYTNKGNFYLDKTESHLGSLTKWSFEKNNFNRTSHPMFSVFISNRKRSNLLKIGKSAFGKRSIFDNLLSYKSSLVHIGRPLENGNTAIHYIENICGAFYRYHKVFPTKVFDNNIYIGKNYSVFVRNTDLRKKYISNTIRIAKKLKEKKLVNEVGNYKTLTNISVLNFSQSVDFMVDEFYKNNKVFI